MPYQRSGLGNKCGLPTARRSTQDQRTYRFVVVDVGFNELQLLVKAKETCALLYSRVRMRQTLKVNLVGDGYRSPFHRVINQCLHRGDEVRSEVVQVFVMLRLRDAAMLAARPLQVRVLEDVRHGHVREHFRLQQREQLLLHDVIDAVFAYVDEAMSISVFKVDVWKMSRYNEAVFAEIGAL